MKILGVLPTYRPCKYNGIVGGGEISNRILFEGLAKKKNIMDVVAVSGGGGWPSDENGVNIYDVSAMKSGGKASVISNLLSFKKQALRVAEERKPDIILTTSQGVPVGLELGSRLNLPVGIFVRAFENFSSQFQVDTVLRSRVSQILKKILIGNFSVKTFDKADFLLANSNFMEQRCLKYAKNVRSYVLYPPFDFKLSQASMSAPTSISNVVMIGTSPKKGVELVKLLSNRMPNINFRIIGDPMLVGPGSEKRIGNLSIVGWLQDYNSIFNGADMVLIPSQWEEPFGRVAIEALAAGKIVLASNIGGLPEAVGYRKELLLSPDDADQWQKKISEVSNDPSHYWQTCVEVRERLKSFSSERVIEFFEKILWRELNAFKSKGTGMELSG